LQIITYGLKYPHIKDSLGMVLRDTEEAIMEIPSNLYYTRDHEWAAAKGNRVTVGITDYAQEQLGDIVYVELPVEGDRVQARETFGVIESVKAVSDLYAPVSGEVLEVNHELLDHPEWVNQDPYGKAWMIAVTLDEAKDLEDLLDSKGYEALLSQAQEEG
jgi:glycine cleavage system H protein